MLTPAPDPSSLGFDPERLSRIDRHFAGYVDKGLLPGWLIGIARRGQLAHLSTYGKRDLEADLPVTEDTIWRIYSMTKPITTVAAMMLYEEGLFELKDPLARYIPAFADMQVFQRGTLSAPVTAPAQGPIRIWHLMTHTAGLTYGFQNADPVDAMYRDAGFDVGTPEGKDLEAACDLIAGFPLLFEPGTEWSYSVATDVLGRVVEVLSGMPLDEFFRQRIFEPLGMKDTSFWVDEPDHGRVAALYTPDPSTKAATRFDELGEWILRPPDCLHGGGGLASTAHDYLRFCEMLRRGGELDGTRLLGDRTLAFMTQNHLPGNADLEQFGRPLFAETAFDGVGFGLGFQVALDPVALKTPGSVGEFAWGGLASTAFWVDPVEDLVAVFFTQLTPSSTYPLRTQLRQLVYASLDDRS